MSTSGHWYFLYTVLIILSLVAEYKSTETVTTSKNFAIPASSITTSSQTGEKWHSSSPLQVLTTYIDHENHKETSDKTWVLSTSASSLWYDESTSVTQISSAFMNYASIHSGYGDVAETWSRSDYVTNSHHGLYATSVRSGYEDILQTNVYMSPSAGWSSASATLEGSLKPFLTPPLSELPLTHSFSPHEAVNVDTSHVVITSEILTSDDIALSLWPERSVVTPSLESGIGTVDALSIKSSEYMSNPNHTAISSNNNLHLVPSTAALDLNHTILLAGDSLIPSFETTLVFFQSTVSASHNNSEQTVLFQSTVTTVHDTYVNDNSSSTDTYVASALSLLVPSVVPLTSSFLTATDLSNQSLETAPLPTLHLTTSVLISSPVSAEMGVSLVSAEISPSASMDTNILTSGLGEEDSIISVPSWSVPVLLSSAISENQTVVLSSSIGLKTTDSPEEGSDSLTVPVIVGISLGSLFFILLLTVCVLALCHRHKLIKKEGVGTKSGAYHNHYTGLWDDELGTSTSYINQELDQGRDGQEEMISLDNDTYLNSLEGMTFTNNWGDNKPNTRF